MCVRRFLLRSGVFPADRGGGDAQTGVHVDVEECAHGIFRRQLQEDGEAHCGHERPRRTPCSGLPDTVVFPGGAYDTKRGQKQQGGKQQGVAVYGRVVLRIAKQVCKNARQKPAQEAADKAEYGPEGGLQGEGVAPFFRRCRANQEWV